MWPPAGFLACHSWPQTWACQQHTPLLQLVAPMSLLPAYPLPTPASLLGPHRGSGPWLWPSSLPATGCLSSLDGGTCQFLPCGRAGYVLLGLSPLRFPLSLRTQLRPWHKETGYLTGSHIGKRPRKQGWAHLCPGPSQCGHRPWGAPSGCQHAWCCRLCSK